MSTTLEFVRGICIIVSLALIAGAVLLRWLQRTPDTGELVKKLTYTALLALFFLMAAHILGAKEYAAGNGSLAMALLPFVAVFCAVIFSIIWTPRIGEWLASSITSGLDGGSEPPDPKPFYSVAKALVGRGDNDGAVEAIRQQLEKFPGDFEGQLLLAEVQAKNLRDLAAAEATVQELCEQPGKPPAQVASALTALADWHLKIAHDQQAARRCLDQIAATFPGSEFSTAAAQRIAHLGDTRMRLPAGERDKFTVTPGIQNYGLRDEPGLIRPKETPPAQQAAELVAHLTEHPLDTDAREKLAELYAGHFQRADLAADQFEQMITQPNQPARNVVKWLNLLADLHGRGCGDLDAAKASLQRILKLFPGTAAAEVAQRRIEMLRLELRGREKTAAVKLGTYEQNIGLKTGWPRRHGG